MAWQDGMGVDPVALSSLGCYTETYGSATLQNICNLYASLGYIEDAPNITINIVAIMEAYKRRRIE